MHSNRLPSTQGSALYCPYGVPFHEVCAMEGLQSYHHRFEADIWLSSEEDALLEMDKFSER